MKSEPVGTKRAERLRQAILKKAFSGEIDYSDDMENNKL